MFIYSYRAVTKENRVVKGTVRALTRVRARRIAEKSGMTVLFVVKEPIRLLQANVGSLFARRFSRTRRIVFFRNFATMLAVGMPVTRAMRVLSGQTPPSSGRRAIDEMIRAVENGRPLSRAFSAFPRYFPEDVCEIVAVGEATGELVETLERIAENMSRDQEIRQKVAGAMAYPAVIIVVMMAVMIILSIVVLPKIAELFMELEVPLPLPTRVLLAAGGLAGHRPWELGIGVAATAGGLAYFLRRPIGRRAADAAFLRTPVFGTLVKEFNLVRFFRATGSLVAGGASLVRSVGIAKKTVRSPSYRAAIEAIEPLLAHGAMLSETLRPFPRLFPDQARHMIAVGEETGRFDDTFRHLTEYYERTIRHKVGMLTAMIEPILMVIVGIIVGGLALTIFMPLYQASYAF
ncbi:MAG: type II secretion system F family protein [Patescibacteria group bacterium]